VPDLIVFLDKTGDAAGRDHLDSADPVLGIDSAIYNVVSHGIDLHSFGLEFEYVVVGLGGTIDANAGD
jgi:hypothetical protein